MRNYLEFESVVIHVECPKSHIRQFLLLNRRKSDQWHQSGGLKVLESYTICRQLYLCQAL